MRRRRLVAWHWRKHRRAFVERILGIYLAHNLIEVLPLLRVQDRPQAISLRLPHLIKLWREPKLQLLVLAYGLLQHRVHLVLLLLGEVEAFAHLLRDD